MREKAMALGKEFLTSFLDICKCALITGLTIWVITTFFVLNAFIPSTSMEPTLPVGSIMICNRVCYWWSSPAQGDIIVFSRSVDDDETLYTKRVVGVGGDEVHIADGEVYINNVLYTEPWLAETTDLEYVGDFIVPEGCYFCMGDNRNESYDCRFWEEHYIEEDDILAKGIVLLSEDGISLV